MCASAPTACSASSRASTWRRAGVRTPRRAGWATARRSTTTRSICASRACRASGTGSSSAAHCARVTGNIVELRRPAPSEWPNAPRMDAIRRLPHLRTAASDRRQHLRRHGSRVVAHAHQRRRGSDGRLALDGRGERRHAGGGGRAGDDHLRWNPAWTRPQRPGRIGTWSGSETRHGEVGSSGRRADRLPLFRRTKRLVWQRALGSAGEGSQLASGESRFVAASTSDIGLRFRRRPGTPRRFRAAPRDPPRPS